MIYQNARLDALMLFFSGNTPKLRQSTEETEKMLTALQHDLYIEMNENLAEKSGYSGRLYLDFVARKFEQLTAVKYLELAMDSQVAGPPHKPMDARVREQYRREGISIDHLYHESDSVEVKLKKTEAFGEVLSLFLSKCEEIAGYLQEQFEHGKEVRRKFITANGLAGHLERAHEEAFFQSVTGPVSADTCEGDVQLLFHLSRLSVTSDNLMAEIDNNFYKCAAAESGPYLEYLLDRISNLPKPTVDLAFPTQIPFIGKIKVTEELTKDWASIQKNYEQVLQSLSRVVLSHVVERLAIQHQRPYLLNLDMEPPLSANQQFFFLAKKGEMHKGAKRTNKEMVLDIQKELSLSDSEIRKKLNYLKTPGRWTDQDKADFWIAKERLERTDVKKYRAVPEEPVWT